MAQFFSDLGIEGAKRFVKEKDFWFNGQCAGKGDALALTSGELAGKTLSEFGELNRLEELLDASANLRFGRALAFLSHAEAESDVLKDAQMLEERVMLKDEARLALVSALRGNIAVAEEDASLIGKFQSRDDAQQCGLA